jgi:hypothetical protein
MVAGEGRLVAKWWDRFWGAAWMVGSVLIAYLTGRWIAVNSAPADLGSLRYGLIAFSSLFGLLVGAFCLSLAVIGITSGIEYLLARWGYPLRPPQLSILAIGPDEPAADPIADTPAEGVPIVVEPRAETPGQPTVTSASG